MATLRTRPSRPPNRFWIVKEELEELGIDPKRTQSYLVYGIFGVLFLVVGTLFVHHLSQDQRQRGPVPVVRGHGMRPPRRPPSEAPRPTPSATPTPRGVTLATRAPTPSPTASSGRRPTAASPSASLPEDLLVVETGPGNFESRLRSFRQIAGGLDETSRGILFGATKEEEVESWLKGEGKERRLHALLLRLRLVTP